MSRAYEIIFKPSAIKDIRRIPRRMLEYIEMHIWALADDPVPHGAKPIRGYKGYFRIRIGRYRVVYEVHTTIRIVAILRIGHRKEVYQHL